jgi:nucleoside-diphosphate-sugar epimerase
VVTSYGHVDELADALAVMASSEAAAGEVFNITGVGVSAEQYVRTLADVVGAKPDIRFVSDDVLPTLERPAFSRLFGARHHGIVSTEKARSRLGVPPERDFRTGHAETYEWFLGSRLASAELNLDDPLWGKGFDLGHEAEVARQLADDTP